MNTKLAPILGFLAVISICGAPAHAESTDVQTPIDLNQGSDEQLQTVPGIGPSKAAKIIEYRQRRPFRTVEELVRVKGFGRKTLVRLRPFLSVDGGSHVAPLKTEVRVARPSPQARADAPLCPACQCVCATSPPATTR
ncbi:MAG: helix-hairpin-helix domain-containing protein [Deltaproteobacteria bacterium]|nr:helix-hairpin-helix domain-containing protein [Deltaproteobacteria bacterium]